MSGAVGVAAACGEGGSRGNHSRSRPMHWKGVAGRNLGGGQQGAARTQRRSRGRRQFQCGHGRASCQGEGTSPMGIKKLKTGLSTMRATLTCHTLLHRSSRKIWI